MRLPLLLLAVAAVVGLRAAPAPPAKPPPCPSLYQESYAADWGLGRAGWEAGCRAGRLPAEILRSAQLRSIEACVRRFWDGETARTVSETEVRAFCAQGPSGRRMLAERTGRPAEEGPAPAPTAQPAPKPRVLSGLGPLSEALAAARSGWKADACLARFEFVRDHPAAEGLRDMYTYYFYSREDWRQTFVYRAGDVLAQAGEVERKRTGHHCLTGVEVDLGEAVERGRRAGVVPDVTARGDRLEVNLDHLSPEVEKSYWTSQLESAEDGRVAKAVRGKVFWEVRSAGRAAFLEARGGEVLIAGPGLHYQNYLPSIPPK